MKQTLIRLGAPPAWLGLAAAIAMTVSPAGAAAARPAAPRAAGAITGRTAQGMAVRLGRQRGAMRAFNYRARLSCSDGSTFTDDPFTDLVRLRGRRFYLSRWSDRDAVHVRLTGVIRGARAHGTLRITERYSEVPDAHGDTPLSADGGILCDSGIVRWNARAARG